MPVSNEHVRIEYESHMQSTHTANMRTYNRKYHMKRHPMGFRHSILTQGGGRRQGGVES